MRIRNPLAGFVAVSVLELIQGCAVSIPSCDGRLEPINAPALVTANAETEEDGAAEREHAP